MVFNFFASRARALFFLLFAGFFLVAASPIPRGYPRSYSDIIEAARKEKRLVIYSTTDRGEIAELLTGFRKRYPFLQLDYREMASGDIFNAVIRETRARKPTGDLVWSAAMDLQIKLVNDGYVQAYASPEKPYLPPWAIWKNEAWGVTAEPVAFVYNRAKMPVADRPRDHQQLLRLLQRKAKSYSGKIAAPDPARSGVGYLYYTQDYLANRGFWDFARALGSTKVQLYPTSGEILRNVADGKQVFGYNVIGSYALEWQSRDPRIGVIMPRDYTLVTSRIVVIPNEARHPNAAKLLLDYMLSQSGQQTLARKFMNPARLPMRPGSHPSDTVARPVRVGPTLLANLDQIKRRRFFSDWKEAISGE